MMPATMSFRVFLDEDVDVLLVPLLTVRGMDCLTTLAAGKLGRPDQQQLEFAIQESRILVTHNRTDFENLVVAWWNQKRVHAGIVLAIRRVNTFVLARHILPALRQ